VQFAGERGEDGGGPTRELLTEAAIDLVSPRSCLFKEFRDGLFVPACSHDVEDSHLMYTAVGALLGLIIRHSLPQDLCFPELFWKFLVTGEIGIEDVYAFDHAYRDEIAALLKMSEQEFNIKYQDKRFVEMDFGGSPIELREGVVTFERVREFISLFNEAKVRGLAEILRLIRTGMLENLGIHEFPIYVTPSLLEFCVCGSPKISAKAMLRVISADGIPSDARAMLFRVIESLSDKQRSLLLKFVTGRVRMPARMEPGKKLFSVQKLFSAPDKLPQASTCFCQLHLPKYSCFKVARKMILTAIENTVTFENR
jgi:E3 ubiquitin-protein ligase HUWE1